MYISIELYYARIFTSSLKRCDAHTSGRLQY